MSSKFVSEGELQKAKEERAKTGAPEPTEYDPRTLYERLQEQKKLKEEEFEQSRRWSNLIKRLDEDDVDFLLQTELDTENRTLMDYHQDKEAIEEFRKAAGTDGPLEETLPADVAMKEIASITKIALPPPSTSSTNNATATRKASTAASHKTLLEGVIRKRKSIDTLAQQEVVKKVAVEVKSNGTVSKPGTAAPKPNNNTSKAAPAKIGLNLLAAYDSDDEEDS